MKWGEVSVRVLVIFVLLWETVEVFIWSILLVIILVIVWCTWIVLILNYHNLNFIFYFSFSFFSFQFLWEIWVDEHNWFDSQKKNIQIIQGQKTLIRFFTIVREKFVNEKEKKISQIHTWTFRYLFLYLKRYNLRLLYRIRHVNVLQLFRRKLRKKSSRFCIKFSREIEQPIVFFSK